MSWFGGFGGSNSGSDDKSDTTSSYGNDTSSFGSESSFSSAPPSSTGGGGGSIQEQLAMEQQKAMVQAVMVKLTDISFDKCVNKPSSSLSSSESNCITAVVGKYLDTSEMLVQKLQK